MTQEDTTPEWLKTWLRALKKLEEAAAKLEADTGQQLGYSIFHKIETPKSIGTPSAELQAWFDKLKTDVQYADCTIRLFLIGEVNPQHPGVYEKVVPDSDGVTWLVYCYDHFLGAYREWYTTTDHSTPSALSILAYWNRRRQANGMKSYRNGSTAKQIETPLDSTPGKGGPG